MTKQVQLRRGTTAEHSVFTGSLSEVTVDTTKNIAVVHDGVTAGGWPLVGAAATQQITNKSGVGIGTTNPRSALTVIGDVFISGIVTASTFSNISINGNSLYGSTVSTSTTTTQLGIHSGLSTSTYRSVEYTIQSTQGTNFHATKILTIHNGTTAYNSEYGTIYNNTSVGTFDVDVSGGNIRLLVTPTSASSTTYTINFVATKI